MVADLKNAVEWVNSEAAKQRKPPKNGGVFSGNGNVEGVFSVETVLVSGDREYIVSAGSEYSVYGGMDMNVKKNKSKAPATAATIFDNVNGVITIRKDGVIKRRRPQASPGQAPPRVPFGAS